MYPYNIIIFSLHAVMIATVHSALNSVTVLFATMSDNNVNWSVEHWLSLRNTGVIIIITLDDYYALIFVKIVTTQVL